MAETICDYIASVTNRFALDEYNEFASGTTETQKPAHWSKREPSHYRLPAALHLHTPLEEHLSLLSFEYTTVRLVV
jgi:hypothetical protein